EGIEPRGSEEVPGGRAVSLALPLAHAAERLAQLRVAAEEPRVHEALRRNRLGDVGGSAVDGDRAGEEAVENLLRDPAFQRHVLEAESVGVAAESLRLRRRPPAPRSSRRGVPRIGTDFLPSFPRGAVEAAQGPGNPRLPDPERRLVPSRAVEIDLSLRPEEGQRPQALGVELLRLEPRQLVRVDHHEELPAAAPPDLLVDPVEGLRPPEALDADRLAREREQRLRVAPGEDALEGAGGFG